jgi:hypothetical protein
MQNPEYDLDPEQYVHYIDSKDFSRLNPCPDSDCDSDCDRSQETSSKHQRKHTTSSRNARRDLDYILSYGGRVNEDCLRRRNWSYNYLYKVLLVVSKYQKLPDDLKSFINEYPEYITASRMPYFCPPHEELWLDARRKLAEWETKFRAMLKA